MQSRGAIAPRDCARLLFHLEGDCISEIQSRPSTTFEICSLMWRPPSTCLGTSFLGPTRTSHNTSHITRSHARRWPDARCVHARWLGCARRCRVAWLVAWRRRCVSSATHGRLPARRDRTTHSARVRAPRAAGFEPVAHTTARRGRRRTQNDCRPGHRSTWARPAARMHSSRSTCRLCRACTCAWSATPTWHSIGRNTTRVERMVLQTNSTTLKCRKCGGAPRGCPTTAAGSASRTSSLSTTPCATSKKAAGATPGENCAARRCLCTARGATSASARRLRVPAGCRTAARRTAAAAPPRRGWRRGERQPHREPRCGARRSHSETT